MTSSDLISGKPKKSLADQIYEQTLEMIVRSPDMVDQVINENRLTELFHVSKAPVREALVRLTSEGVLHSVPRYGYVVERISPIDRKVVVDQRIYLEQKALTISFPNMTDDNLAGIRQQLEKASRKENVDVWIVWEDNIEFHLLLASFAGSNVLNRCLQQCLSIQERMYAETVWSKRNNLVDSIDMKPHETIYRKIESRDFEGSMNQLKLDIESSLK